jgi:hypothetical protein
MAIFHQQPGLPVAQHGRELVSYTSSMRITPDIDEAPDFIRQVEQVANGVIPRHAPETLVLIKIDNFFGSNWLGFSGKALGAIEVWHNPSYHPANIVRIPPFVPNRVVSQRRFSSPNYEEIDCGKPIHKRMPSRVALNRTVAGAAPKSALIWYSGESKVNGRGAVMACSSDHFLARPYCRRKGRVRSYSFGMQPVGVNVREPGLRSFVAPSLENQTTRLRQPCQI